jgi:hypothetical protein
MSPSLKEKPIGSLKPMADPAISMSGAVAIKAARMEAWACPEDPDEVEIEKENRIAAWKLQSGVRDDAS